MGWRIVYRQQQDASKVSKAARLSKAEAVIDWNQTVRAIDCHVRGMQPWPIAFTHLQMDESKPAIRLAVKEVSASDVPAGQRQCGEIVAGDGFLVAVADGVIEIVRLQPAGKREMPAADFLRGHQPKPGTKLQ